MELTIIRDYTWPVCRNCRYRVVVEVHMFKHVQGYYAGEQVEEAYICKLGLNRDRNQDFCPLKEER